MAAHMIPRSGRIAGFSAALQCGLIIPATAFCLAFVATQFLEPRSRWMGLVIAVYFVAAVIELMVVPVAIWRLYLNDHTRTTRNVVFTTLGTVCLLQGLAIYLLAVLND